MYAIIETVGKQYKVQAGDVLYIEKLDVEADAEVTFDKVIAVGADDGIKVGAPYVDGATVSAKAIKNGITAYLNAADAEAHPSTSLTEEGDAEESAAEDGAGEAE